MAKQRRDFDYLSSEGFPFGIGIRLAVHTQAMSSSNLVVRRQFEIDSRQENAEFLVEENKKALEDDARDELDERMGNTLADFQMWPTWTVEGEGRSGIRIYSLIMKVVFKP
jgi:hypothetical protein